MPRTRGTHTVPMARSRGVGGRKAQQRPVWARTLDVAADVLLGVGLAVAAVTALGAVATLVGRVEAGFGDWMAQTATTLAGPVPQLVQTWVADEPSSEVAALGLGVAALLWAAAGWVLSRLVRPG